MTNGNGKVFITHPIPQEVLDYIGQHCEYDMWESAAPLSRDELFHRIAVSSGLIASGGYKIDDEVLACAPHLKIVSLASVGYNNLHIDALKRRGVMATHTPEVLDETVADLVFALMLASARRIAELDRYMREGNWIGGSQTHLFGIDVHHATVGIIGMGRIGEAIARRAKFGFNMNVLYYNRTRKPEAEAKFSAVYCELNALLEQSDFVVLMTPLTPETTRMIGAAEFRRMKSSAIFINASRGQTIDEQALVDALQSGTIHAAGLDVYEQEPIQKDHPLLKLPNVVLAPHIGSATARTRFDMAMLAARNLIAALQGEVPPNLIPELR